MAEGDEVAFGEVFHIYYSRLLNFLSKFGHDSHRIDEAVQETFIKVWLARDQVATVENFQAWLFTIASRQAISLLRKDLVQERNTLQWTAFQTSVDAHTPADLVQLGEMQSLIKEAVERMPPSRQRIYRMSREEGLKPADIAEQLNLSASTVKNSLVSALQEIRAYLLVKGYTMSMIGVFIYCC